MFPFLLALGKKMPIIGDVIAIFDSDKEKRPTPRRYAPNRNYDPEF